MPKIENNIHHIYLGLDISKYLTNIEHQIERAPGYTHHLWLYPYTYIYPDHLPVDIQYMDKPSLTRIIDFCKHHDIRLHVEAVRVGEALLIKEEFGQYAKAHNIQKVIESSLELVQHLHRVNLPSGAKDILMPLILLIHGGICMDLTLSLKNDLPVNLLAENEVLFYVDDQSGGKILDLGVFAGVAGSKTMFAFLWTNCNLAKIFFMQDFEAPKVTPVLTFFKDSYPTSFSAYGRPQLIEVWKDLVSNFFSSNQKISLMSTINAVDIPYRIRAKSLLFFSGTQNFYAIFPSHSRFLSNVQPVPIDAFGANLEAWCFPHGYFQCAESISRKTVENREKDMQEALYAMVWGSVLSVVLGSSPTYLKFIKDAKEVAGVFYDRQFNTTVPKKISVEQATQVDSSAEQLKAPPKQELASGKTHPQIVPTLVELARKAYQESCLDQKKVSPDSELPFSQP